MLKRQLPHLHDHLYVVVHVLVNVPQKACRNDTHATKRNTGKVHIFVALRICDLTRRNHHLVRGVVASNAWDLLQAIQRPGPGRVKASQIFGWVGDPSSSPMVPPKYLTAIGPNFWIKTL